jgi:hypothetical protein
MIMKNTFIIMILFVIAINKSFSQNKSSVLQAPAEFDNLLLKNNVWGEKIFIGNSKENEPIHAYYYNKNGSEKAMIIAGVHGSEFYGVDVVNALIDSLNNLNVQTFKWKILIIPNLFPDNIPTIDSLKFCQNVGRKSCKECLDPNRQMPKLNVPYKIGDTLSNNNDKIELENQYLLYITQQFNPTRIASVHCKNQVKHHEIGIYADPITYNRNGENIAFDFSGAKKLAIRMASYVNKNKGRIEGNFFQNVGKNENIVLKERSEPNAVYPQDPKAVGIGEKQKRNYETGIYKNQISFGTWASSEIKQNNKRIKHAATMLTVELPQYSSFFYPEEYRGVLDEQLLKTNTMAYVNALKNIFLENK